MSILKIKTALSGHLPLLSVVAITVLACGVPVGVVVSRAWGVWRDVPFAYIGDALFYLAQVKAVAGGDLFFPNTFYIEHAYGVAVSFATAEWFATIPYLITHSWAFTIVWNIFFFAVVFSVLSYFTFRIFQIGKWLSAFGALLMFSQVCVGFFRPVIMQVPYAVFALVLFVVALFMSEPTKKSRVAFLAVAGALAVYTYTFLGQVIVAFFGALLGCFLLFCRWLEARALFIAGLGSAVLGIPFVAILFTTISDPNYVVTLGRLELVHSHIPNPEVYFFGRWVLLVLVVWAIFWRYTRNVWEDIDTRRMFFGCSLAFGTLLVLLSPIVTGKDIQGAGHAGRFSLPILALNAVFFTALLQKKEVQNALRRIIPATLIFLSVLFFVLGFSQNTLTIQLPLIPSHESIGASQEYAPVLDFLAHQERPAVVWANEQLSSVMFVTRQYVLSAPFGSTYLTSVSEVHDRYLASQYPAVLTTQIIAGDADTHNFRSVDARDANNRQRSLCRVLARLYIGSITDCPAVLNYQEAMGEEYFTAILRQYQTVIFPHINTILDHFHVRYIVRDRIHDIPLDPKSVRGASIYDDGRFIVYERDLPK